MRDYAKVEPKMWHGQTMKVLRKKGPEAPLVALYLMTSPNSNMLGIYSQPVLYMAHETGLGEEGALKGLKHCIEAALCSYDEESEIVWVHEMARYQIASELKPLDLRCKGIQKEYDSLPDNPFLAPFYDRYATVFHLQYRREFGMVDKAPSIAPIKALRSQEQEQEQEQENICPELLTASEPVSAFSIPLVDSTEFWIPEKLISEWTLAFPAVDVEQELRQMRVWISANSTKRKTRRGVSAFIVRWLSKAQDMPSRAVARGGPSTGSAWEGAR